MRAAWSGDDLRHIADGSLRFAAEQASAMRAKAIACEARLKATK
jgi:hypothetical protein